MIGINQIAYDKFEVVDIDTKEIITGLVDGDFTKILHTPSGTSSFLAITELVSGTYQLQFTPNAEGPWGVTLIHDTYFPWGKRGSYICSDLTEYKADITGLATESNATTNKNDIITAISGINLDTSGIALEATLNTALTGIANLQVDLDNPDQYKANISALATEVNATANRDQILTGLAGVQDDLNNPDQYKADITGVALEANATANKNTIVSDIAAAQSSVDGITAKLPDQYIMGSSTPANADDNIYAIQAKTDLIPSGLDTILASIATGVDNIESIITGMEGETALLSGIYEDVMRIKARLHNYVITGIVRNEYNKSTSHEIHTYYDTGYLTGLEDVEATTEYDANGNISKAEYKYAD